MGGGAKNKIKIVLEQRHTSSRTGDRPPADRGSAGLPYIRVSSTWASKVGRFKDCLGSRADGKEQCVRWDRTRREEGRAGIASIGRKPILISTYTQICKPVLTNAVSWPDLFTILRGPPLPGRAKNLLTNQETGLS